VAGTAYIQYSNTFKGLKADNFPCGQHLKRHSSAIKTHLWWRLMASALSLSAHSPAADAFGSRVAIKHFGI
jgi:hypothetical protein